MQIKISRVINGISYMFDVSNEKALDALVDGALFTSMSDKCGLCKSENIHLSSNKAKGFTFVKMLCSDCNARSQLGTYKEGGYFWKEWEKYEPVKEKVIEQ